MSTKYLQRQQITGPIGKKNFGKIFIIMLMHNGK